MKKDLNLIGTNSGTEGEHLTRRSCISNILYEYLLKS